MRSSAAMRCERVLYIAASVALVDADVQVGSAGRASLVLGDDRGGCLVDLVIGPQQVRAWRRARQLGLRQLAVAGPFRAPVRLRAVEIAR